MRKREASILAIFITVFVDLLSFGLVIPDLQLRGRALGIEGTALGLLIGSYSLAQLLTAPYLGRLSDRVGRRSVLLVTTLVSVLGFAFYAHADQFYGIFMARVLGGITGGNLGVAYAYIADVTKPEDRAKGMGMVGAAFGLGFILGPVFGALLIRAGNDTPLLLGYTGAAIAALNFLYVWRLLPEPVRHVAAAQGSFIANMRRAFATPGLALLLLMFFTTNLGFTNLESTFFQLLAEPNWTFSPVVGGNFTSAKWIGAFILGYVGIIAAIMQGYVVRRVTPVFGEPKLVRFAYILQVPALAAVPFVPLWLPLLLLLLMLGVASGLLQPSLSSLVSRSAPSDMQGSIFGVTQSLGATARFVGPLISNTLFDIRPYWPYLLGAGIILFPAFASWRIRLPQKEEAA